MLALGLVALVPLLMWTAQSVLLLSARQPLRWRLSAPDLPRSLKRVNRALTHASFAAVLLAYPLLQGLNPLRYYAGFLPLGRRPLELVTGLCAAVLFLSLLYLGWLMADNVRFRVRHSAGRLVQRLAGVPFTAFLIAFVEELLFRAMLLAGLVASFGRGHIMLAVALGAVVFASAHYVRAVKRYWTFAGHLALGTLFNVAFVCTGAIWLSLGLHAGGVLVLMAVRPFVRYTGPPWLVGASIFPYAGLAGVVALGVLTLSIWLHYGIPA